MLRFHSDWSYAGVVVRGSRNPYGLALRPSTGDAYVTINGQDNLGAQPADELLRVADGQDAGWPRCWPAYPDGSLQGNCSGVAAPISALKTTRPCSILAYERPALTSSLTRAR